MDFLLEAIGGLALVGGVGAAIVMRRRRAAQLRKHYMELESTSWNALRHDSLSRAEEAMAMLLHFVGDGKQLPPYIYASALYTHGCLLVEEESDAYAAERFSASMHIARTAYGENCLQVAPPTVAMSYLYFQKMHLEKSGRLLVHCREIYSRHLGAEHPRTLRIRAMLALVAFAAGCDEEARTELVSLSREIARSSGDNFVLRKQVREALTLFAR